MIDDSKLVAVELTLLECAEWLRGVAPGPAVRELRVRLVALSRVVSGWRVNPPHSAQMVAMLECALELRALVARVCVPGAPDTMPSPPPDPPPPSAQPRSRSSGGRSASRPRRVTLRTARPPGRDAGRTTRPPGRRRSRGS
jgi:hypothetical protein